MQQIRNALPERNIVTDSTHVASPDEGGGALCVGVLALQGDFREHRKILDVLGATTVLVRTPEDLEAVDALILPGGESTTIARLIRSSGLWDPLVARLAAGMPAWGTCAGAILLAREVPGFDRDTLGVMAIRAERNAFGRQIDSFEEALAIEGIDGPPHSAVFIRAPVFEGLGSDVKVLARLSDGRVVAVCEGVLLATAFHPELTADRRLHALFLAWVGESTGVSAAPETAE